MTANEHIMEYLEYIGGGGGGGGAMVFSTSGFSV